MAKPSSPTPRPPATTTLASVSSGRSPCTAGVKDSTVASSAPGPASSRVSIVASAAGTGSAGTAPGRSVYTGHSPPTAALTETVSPKMDCCAVRSGLIPTTSHRTPLARRAAKRPAISLPVAWPGTMMGPGWAAARVCRASTAGSRTLPWELTCTTRWAPSCVISSASSGASTSTAVTSPRLRATVIISAVMAE